MESDNVCDLLNKAAAAHQLICKGLEAQIKELKEKVGKFERIIERLSTCDQCKRMLNEENIKIDEKKDFPAAIIETKTQVLRDDRIEKDKENERQEKGNDDDATKINATRKLSLDDRQSKKIKIMRTSSPLLFSDDEGWIAKKRITKQVTLDDSFRFAIDNSNTSKMIAPPPPPPAINLTAKQEEGRNITPSISSNKDKWKTNASIYNGSVDPSIELLQDDKTDEEIILLDTERKEFKFKSDVTRKQNERSKLKGFGCKECKAYYENLGLSSNEVEQRVNQCSRHRDHFSPPPTPNGFWAVEFPPTQENGILNKTQYRPLQSRRKR